MKVFALDGYVLALAVAVLVASPSNVRAQGNDKTSSAGPADETSAEVIASHVREHGDRCEKPQTAERDSARSKPDEAVWLLKCENADYRITLIPHIAARVERVGSRPPKP